MGYTESSERDKPITRKRGVDPKAVGTRPAGAVTNTVSTSAGGNRMPRVGGATGPDVGGGAMPSKADILPRVKREGIGLSPNPAERIPGAFHPGAQGRFTGNFGDRKTSAPKPRIPYSPSSTDEAGVKGPYHKD